MTGIESNISPRSEDPHVKTTALIEQSTRSYDEDMFPRRVYQISESVSLFFRGREEKVALSGDADVIRVTLGDSPNWLLKQDDKLNLERFDIATPNKVEISVSKTLKGVLEAALILKPDNQDVREMLGELSAGITSDRSQKLIDTLIAANVISDDGSLRLRNEDLSVRVLEIPHAEMLMVLALNGDLQAKAALESKYDSLMQMRSSAETNIPLRREHVGELKVEDLVCVHTTSYRPQINAEGDALVKTTHDATSGKFLRNTVHTALNHKVSSHAFGNWDGALCTIISPFASVMEVNGKPTMLNTVDTWWSIAPGDRMIFPKAQVVLAGSPDQQNLLESHGNETRFKTGRFNYGDLRELAPNFRRYSDEKIQFIAKTSTADDFELLPEDLAKQVAQRVHDYAVNKVISEIGFEVKSGGMWSWSNDISVTYQSANLASTLKIGHGNHTDSPESSLERSWANAVSAGISPEISSDYVVESAKIKLPRVTDNHIKSASMESLRALYQVGGFFGRV